MPERHAESGLKNRRMTPQNKFRLVAPESSVYCVSMSSAGAEERELVRRVLATRRATMGLVEPLEVEDWVVQSMPDASPVKWHLAHTTWFFERFVLRDLGIPPVHEAFDYLFNSYYESVGSRHPRPKRGVLTRPTAAAIVAYRKSIDGKLAELEGSPRLGEVAAALELGLQHEQQHQELLLTDVKHLFGENPLFPAYQPTSRRPSAPASDSAPPLQFVRFEGGVYSIGHEGDGFSFDNERPRHRVFTTPFALATRLVTTAEYRAFIEDGGYERPELWLSEGWAWVNAHSIRAPMYWDKDHLATRSLFTLHGRRSMIDAEPVCHVTYYEADAYARWAGARLPREAEWEIAAERGSGTAGELLTTDGDLHPRRAVSEGGAALSQMIGDAWEWTQSAYSPYPGFKPLAGAFGEYNGKFMVSQMVLRGGSCVTPKDHARATYRNFFPPNAAWQFTGIRLAKDTDDT